MKKNRKWMIAWFMTILMLATMVDATVFAIAPESSTSTFKGEDVLDLNSNIYLRALIFDTRHGEPDITPLLKYNDLSKGEPNYYLVQFVDSTSMIMGKKAIEDIGGIFFTLIPKNTYIVKMIPEVKIMVNQLECVQWVGIYHPFYKIDPDLIELKDRTTVIISIFDSESIDQTMNAIEIIGGTKQENTGYKNRIKAEIDGNLIPWIARIKSVEWIEPWYQPIAFNSNARGIVQSGQASIEPLFDEDIYGNGQILAITDTGIDVLHPAFFDPLNNIGPNHRKILDYYVPVGSGGALGDECNPGHGTHVSGTAAGDDSNWGTAEGNDGNALGARIIVQDIDNFCEPPPNPNLVWPGNNYYANLFQPAFDAGARVHTNSWGGGVMGYTGFTQQIDDFMNDNNDFLILFAMGNSQTPVPNSLTPQAEAKNIISVGASWNIPNNINELWLHSNLGPATDGRIKPDVIAPGCIIFSAWNGGGYFGLCGTSMATPAVAAAAALVRQYFISGFYPTGTHGGGISITPSAALVKAVLINSAEEITGVIAQSNCPSTDPVNGFCYPNYAQGWGRVNLDNTLYFERTPIDTRRMVVWDETMGINHGSTSSYQIYVHDTSQPLEITLAWTDVEGVPSPGPQLQNNLNLRVTDPLGNIYNGNTFIGSNPGRSRTGNSFWDTDNPPDGFDDINNVEAVILLSGQLQPGFYTIDIIGHDIAQPSPGTIQPYALVATGGIEMTEPTASVSYPDRWINTETIDIELAFEDPESGIADGDLEYKEVPIVNGITGDFSAVAWQEVGVDGGDLGVDTFQGANGNAYMFRFRAKNNAEMWSEYDEPIYVTKIDTVAPNIPVLCEDKCNCPDDDHWSNDNEPHFFWADPGDPEPNSGVAHFEGRHIILGIVDTFNLGDIYEYSPTFEDGIHTFEIRAVDNAGNIGEWSNALPLYIDATPPDKPIVTSLTHSDENAWYSDNTGTLEWETPYDEYSQVHGYYYIFDTIDHTIPDESTGTWYEGNAVIFTGSDVEEGENWFHIVAKDNANNIGEATHFRIQIDMTPPFDISIIINDVRTYDGEDYINTRDVTLTLSISDQHSQPGGMKVWNDGDDEPDEWEPYVTTKDWTLSEGADGPRTVFFKGKDSAIPPNEAGPVSATVILDRIPPKAPRSLTASFTLAPYKFDISNVYLFWDLSEDDGAGENDVVNYKAYKDVNIDGEYLEEACESPNTGHICVDIDAGKKDAPNYFYKIYAVDKAGNMGTIDEIKAGKFKVPVYKHPDWGGLNFISTPLIPKDTSRDEVLKSIAGKYNHLSWYYRAADETFEWDRYYTPYYRLTDIDHKMSFWIDMDNDDTIVFLGSVPIAPAIKMYIDYNDVGYPSFTPITVEEAFENLGFVQVSTFDNQLKIPEGLGYNDELVPGQGYSVWVWEIPEEFVRPYYNHFTYGEEITGKQYAQSNDGEYHTIQAEVVGVEVILDVIYDIPLFPQYPEGEIWTFYLDAFFEPFCMPIPFPPWEICLGGPFTVSYQDPVDSSWVEMFEIDPTWTDDPSGTMPSHKFDFPKGFYANSYWAYIRITTSCLIYELGCIGQLDIDQMVFHTRSSGVWHLTSQESDVQFSSLDITFSDDFPQFYQETIIDTVVYNIGDSDIEDITISIYEVESFTTLISIPPPWMVVGESNVPVLDLLKQETFDIGAQSSYLVSTEWYPGDGLPIIYVVVDYNTEERDGYIAEAYREVVPEP